MSERAFHFSPRSLPTSPFDRQLNKSSSLDRLTELDAWVVVANLVALVVGKEHVGRETTLWLVWVLETLSVDSDALKQGRDSPFFLRPPSALPPFLTAPREVLTSLGMVNGC